MLIHELGLHDTNSERYEGIGVHLDAHCIPTGFISDLCIKLIIQHHFGNDKNRCSKIFTLGQITQPLRIYISPRGCRDISPRPPRVLIAILIARLST